MSHLFVGPEYQSEGGDLLSLGAEQRLELQDLLHADLLVLVHQRRQLSGCSSLSGQLQRRVYCPLQVLHLGEEMRTRGGKIHRRKVEESREKVRRQRNENTVLPGL